MIALRLRREILLSRRVQNDEALVDALLERLGVDGAGVFSVAPAAGGAAAGGRNEQGSRLLEHLGWPCTLRNALLVRVFWQQLVFAVGVILACPDRVALACCWSV